MSLFFGDKCFVCGGIEQCVQLAWIGQLDLDDPGLCGASLILSGEVFSSSLMAVTVPVTGE